MLGCFLSGDIRIKTKHHFIDKSLQYPRLILGEGRPLRCNHILNALFEERDQIELPFANDGAVCLDQSAFCFVQTEKHMSFSKERSFRRIDVFGRAGMAVQDATGERDYFTHIIEDGEHHAVAKPVVKIAGGLLFFAQFYQATCKNLLPSITLAVGPVTKFLPAVRGVTELPCFCDLTFDPASFEVIARRRAEIP